MTTYGNLIPTECLLKIKTRGRPRVFVTTKCSWLTLNNKPPLKKTNLPWFFTLCRII
jgi:hypothetical protein